MLRALRHLTCAFLLGFGIACAPDADVDQEIAEAQSTATGGCEQLAEKSREICREVVQAQMNQFARFKQSREDGSPKGKTIGRTIEALLGTVQAIGSDFPPELRWLCRLHNNGQVTCADVREMLAALDNDHRYRLAADLKAWFADAEAADTLVYCGFAEWTTAHLGATNVADLQAVGDLGLEQLLIAACSSPTGTPNVGPAGAGQWLGSAAGFQGGEAQCLASEVSGAFGTPGTPSTVGAIVAMARETTEICSSSPLTDGGDISHGGQDPSDFVLPEVCTLTDALPIGNLVHSEYDCLYANGARFIFDDVTDSIVEYEKYSGTKRVVRDENGQVVSEAGDVYLPNGGTLEYSEDDDEATYRFEHGDDWWTMTLDKGTNLSTYEDSDGNTMVTDDEGDLVFWEKGGNLICTNLDQSAENDCEKPSSNNTAVDCPADDPEVCGSCGTAVETFVDMVQNCAHTLGTHPRCRAYVNASACCERPSVDVYTLVIPNPTEFICLGEPVESAEERCEKLCETSDDPGCVENCLARPVLDPSLFLTDFCLLAESDACWGPGASPTPGGAPLPMPSGIFLYSK